VYGSRVGWTLARRIHTYIHTYIHTTWQEIGCTEDSSSSSSYWCAGTGARVLRGPLDLDVSPTWMSVPLRRAAAEERVWTWSVDTSVSVLRVSPGATARPTSTNVSRSRAAGPERSVASSWMRVPDIGASAWTDGLDHDVKPGCLSVRASMEDGVRNRQLQPFVHVLR